MAEAALTLSRQWIDSAREDAEQAVSAEQIQLLTDEITRRLNDFGSFNLLGLLGWLMPGQLGLTVDAALPASQVSGSSMVVFILASGFLGLALAAFFYGAIAQAVRGEPFAPLRLLARAPRDIARLVAWLILCLVVGFAALAPLSVMIGLLGLLSPVLATAVVVLAWAGAMVVAWWLAFAASALFLNDIGPLRASFASLVVVGRNPAASLAFVGVVWLLTIGWPLVWNGLTALPVGQAIAIAGQAYLSSGLVAATMIFYRDRMATVRRG